MGTEGYSASPTVEVLLREIPSVHEGTNCLKVLEMFHENKKLYAIPVVNDKDVPVGMVIRQEFTELFSKRYQTELKGKKPISDEMDKTPIVVGAKTSVDDIARIIIDAGIEYMVYELTFAVPNMGSGTPKCHTHV